jgi:carbon-monoxide dehydrogenase medium subunit
VIPAPFDYQAPTTVDEAVRLLGQAAADGKDAKVLGGGQSLIPVLRLRLAAPELLVDLGRIGDLTDIRDDGDAVVIGAMATHDSVIRNDVVRQHALLLALATETVADPQVRHRGTFGGSLVHADPAGDLPAPALALDAQMVIAGPGGQRRTVAAPDFFTDLFTCAVGEGDILVEVRVPKYTGWGASYQKLNRVAQAWSIVAVAAAIRTDGDTIAEARIGLTNMGATPVRARAVEQALVGQPATAEAIKAAASAAGADTQPPSDSNADADYRRHLAGVLTGRAVLAATAS